MKKLVVLLLLGGCATTPVNPNPTPANEEVTCQMACNNLYYMGCIEGENPECKDICEKALQTKVVDFDLKCWATAIGKEAIRACGGVECP